MLEKSKLLIIDPSTDSRMKIKAVASAFMRVDKLMQATNPLIGLDYIKENEPFDIVFVSSSFSSTVISNFVTAARELPSGHRSAYVLLVKPKHQESSYIVSNIMEGVDGFVLEPLSVDTFIEVVNAAREKAKDGPLTIDSSKQCTLVKFLISDAIAHIDKCAAKLAVGRNPGYAMHDLKDTAAKLSNLTNEMSDQYYDILIESFGKVPPPKPIKNKVQRPQKTEQKKVAKKIEAKAGQGYFIRKR